MTYKNHESSPQLKTTIATNLTTGPLIGEYYILYNMTLVTAKKEIALLVQLNPNTQ